MPMINMSMIENVPFSFEFHSLIPCLDCKTVADTENRTTLKIFGRTRQFESICANVIGHLPYFYISSVSGELDLKSPFGNEKTISAFGIDPESFKISLIEKIPFYNFHEGTQSFLKIECCSEAIRKRLINFIKDTTTLQYNLYEAHISFTLQFMSDFGIVGMGLIHVPSPFFLETSEKSTTCDLECNFPVKDILNTKFIKENNTSRSLLPTLSHFMDNLGINDISFLNQNQDSNHEIHENIFNLWPPFKQLSPEISKSKLKCPTFKHYLFHVPPPENVTDYSPIEISENSKCTDSSKAIGHPCHFTPTFDPPLWSNVILTEPSENFISPRKQIIERLTLGSSSKNTFPIYNFNGDFYLKFIALECYEEAISDNPPISTIVFSIFHGNYRKTYILSTIDSKMRFNEDKFTLVFFSSEFEMVSFLIQIVLTEDPDILVGFEVDNKSWGYVSQRFDVINQGSKITFRSEIGRSIYRNNSLSYSDPYIARASSNFQSNGRIVLNLWKIYRDEVHLRLYTLGDICNHYFNLNISSFSSSALIEIMHCDFHAFLGHVVSNIDQICNLTMKTPFLVKSIEFSRLFGIDLFSTLTRGSQYRVESILISAAHSENFLLRTPTEIDVRNMRAAQGLPLTMEPVSNYYRDPMVVLDFQSLYPSMIIAHNFCYSTIFGTMHDDKILSCGAVSSLSSEMYNLESLSKISQYSTFRAPGNIVFVRKDQKIGLLPRLLNEILTTRIAIKKAMKTCDSKVKNVLDARQLALKYISNVTYGYTAASFSGRMPNVDIADAIVMSGRKTLERAVDIIESHTEWEARVVYGDTDSLFILLPGRSLSEAFKIGRDMADLVTAESPAPIALKFEKVYFPSILMSKKRYCGYKYETEGDPPVFDAKGIETVRRDGCNLAAKVLEKSIMLLFSRNDENLIKEYVQRQLVKILTYQKVNVADFIFAREVRFGTYKSEENNKLPLSAIAAKNRQSRNPRDIISFSQRVPFVIVSKPFSKLHQQVVDLEEFLNKNYKLDVIYYATKQLLAVLSRVFSIQGIDVRKWYNELPLAQLKQVCNPRTNSIFGRLNSSCIVSDTSKTIFSEHLQEALKLQKLNYEDFKTMKDKVECCGNLKCLNWSCKVFWARYNFEHLHSEELAALRNKIT